MIMRQRRWSQEGFVTSELSEYNAGAVDLYCINKSGGALAGVAAGCDWVDFDVTQFVRGEIPAIVAAPVSAMAIGCVHWQEGSVANNKGCWVRIFGWHPYAKVLGHASLTAGYPLVIDASTAGLATYNASPYTRRLGRIVAAYTTVATAPKAVFITNPWALPL